MRRYAKLEPMFLADMMQSEARLYVPKRDVPYGSTDAPVGYEWKSPTLHDVMVSRIQEERGAA